VLGASGGIGAALVHELVARHRPVRAVSRSGHAPAERGIEVLAADVTTADGVRQACTGAAVVYHCAQPPYHRWAQEFPWLTAAVLDGVAKAGAKLVFADNLYQYGPVNGPLSEDLPGVATFPKGRVRAEMAEAVLTANSAGTVRTTIGRASDYYGPGGVNTTHGPTIFAAAVSGKKARWIGSLDMPHTVSYLPDIAKGLAILGERPEADGQAWHLPAAEPVTGRQFLEMVFAALDRPAEITHLSRPMQRVIGLLNRSVRELAETWYQRERPFVVDWSKFDAAFGPFTVTPHPKAIADTLEWYKRHPQ
jgi:nucleoside-diphosphate-sugar epimerase